VPSRLDRVVSALERAAGVDEFVAVERRGERARSTSGAAASRAAAELHEVRASVYRDLRRGRGSATLVAGSDDPRALAASIDEAASRARDGVGPPWRLPPPSAPARVAISDPVIEAGAFAAIDLIEAYLADLAARAGLSLAAVRVAAVRERVRVRTSRRFDNAFDATTCSVEAVLSAEGGPGEAVERVRRRARRVDDLALEQAVAGAGRRLRARRDAAALPPGRYDLLLRDDAVTPEVVGGLDTGGADHDRYGWFAPLVAQASADRARRGLTLYRPGQSIYGQRPLRGEPLTVHSDGTLPFGLGSRPFGELGEPVRRFTLVDGGVAAEVALEQREAALRGVPANGGVRNLVVAGGAAPLETLRRPGPRPLVEVFDLAWLETDLQSGALVAELGLGTLHAPGAAPAPVTGGALRGDLFDLLAKARFSAETRFAGWYLGPTAIRLDDVAVR
jgi:predicted Zn-dependent protease